MGETIKHLTGYLKCPVYNIYFPPEEFDTLTGTSKLAQARLRHAQSQYERLEYRQKVAKALEDYKEAQRLKRKAMNLKNKIENGNIYDYKLDMLFTPYIGGCE